MFISAYREGLAFMRAPIAAFEKLPRTSFEAVFYGYLRRLVTIGIIAALLSVLFEGGRAAYRSIRLQVSIDLGRFVNFLLGQSLAILINYVIIGIFGVFFLSLLLLPIARLKYPDLLKVIFMGLTPALLFGIAPLIAASMLLPSAWLILAGLRSYREVRIKKTSIAQRE